MAFDGITVACMAHELHKNLSGGRISKIAQPETDELLLTIKSQEGNFRLLLSASASLPLVYLTQTNKPSPLTAPNFCMLLRKHISGGRIIAVTQPSMERILRFEIEHLDEMGDQCRKFLIVELMGKYSNIIFCNEQDQIIDSIKHISAQVSSVREVLPGRPYFIPDTQDKADPFTLTEEDFVRRVAEKSCKLSKALYTSITGLSPIASEEICHLASLDSDRPATSYEPEELIHLYRTFGRYLDPIREGGYEPSIYYEGKVPVEFSCLPLSIYDNCRCEHFPTVSSMLEQYYAERNTVTRIRQKSTDLRRIVQTALERNIKKYDLQAKQLKDTEKREKYRIYGELINTYGYDVPQGSKSFQALNYYTGEDVTIRLDPRLGGNENAQKYFRDYKKKQTAHAMLQKLLVEGEAEIEYLRTVLYEVESAPGEMALNEIRAELKSQGYLKYYKQRDRKQKPADFLRYTSSDGFEILVGRNNLQNDKLTLHTARGKDLWFHVQKAPGSHVVVMSHGEDIPDTTKQEAAELAVIHSSAYKAGTGAKVAVDTTEVKNIWKANGAKPGMVLYEVYTTVYITPRDGLAEQLKKK